MNINEHKEDDALKISMHYYEERVDVEVSDKSRRYFTLA